MGKVGIERDPFDPLDPGYDPPVLSLAIHRVLLGHTLFSGFPAPPSVHLSDGCPGAGKA